MYFRTEGIILSQKKYGEADKLLTVYTKSSGKISCLAKGARKPLSKKTGHIELGNICKMFVAKGKNIDLLTEAEVKIAFGAQNPSFEKANKIYHLLEIVDHLTPANQRNIDVFNLLASVLKNTSSANNFNLISAIFKVKLLALLGYFSTANLKNSNTKNLLERFEKENINRLKLTIELSESDYLKLLSFLDSIIENLTERKLRTNKFIYG